MFNKPKIKKNDEDILEETPFVKKNKDSQNNENKEKITREKSNIEIKKEPKEVAKSFWNKYYGDNNNNNSNKYDYDLSYEVNPEAVVPKEISELGK